MKNKMEGRLIVTRTNLLIHLQSNSHMSTVQKQYTHITQDNMVRDEIDI